jgi:pimeloyl-ACP methyl ester carboxylesterase
MYRTGYPEATKNEYIAMKEMLSQPNGPASLGDLPLIVLSASDSVSKTPDAVINAMGREAFAKMVQAAQELQQELADLSTQGKLIGVKDSGHYIQWDQPGAVIDAIREVVEQVRE